MIGLGELLLWRYFMERGFPPAYFPGGRVVFGTMPPEPAPLTKWRREAEALFHRAAAAPSGNEHGEREYARALLAVALQNYPECIESASAAIAKNHARLDYLHLWRGVAHFYLAHLQEAVEDHRKAVTFFPNLAWIQSNCGGMFFALDRYDEAIEHFTRALEISPDLWEARFCRAASYDIRGNRGKNPDDARKAKEDLDFLLALPNCPKDPERLSRILLRLGYVLSRQNRDEEAQEQFHRVIELLPGNAEAHSCLGAIEMRAGRREEALRLFERARELDPKYGDNIARLAEARRFLHDLDGALEAYEEAMRLDPRSALAWHGRGIVRALQQDLSAADADLSKALELDPALGDAAATRGEVRFALGNLDAAIRDFDLAESLGVRTALLYYKRANWRGIRWERSGSPKEETTAVLDANERDLRKALQINPDLACAYVDLGITLFKRGKFAEAKSSLERALKLDPSLEPVAGKLLDQIRRRARSD